jgi:hypothetical protein
LLLLLPINPRPLLLLPRTLLHPRNAAPRSAIASRARFYLNEGHDANNVKETEYVNAMQIQANGGHATVTDLSGCTALFFYMSTTLRRAVHITCGNEEADAKIATQAAAGADSVTIGASDQKFYDNAVKGIHAAKANMKINNGRIYDKNKVSNDKAVTFTGSGGSTTISEGTGPRVCKQTQ